MRLPHSADELAQALLARWRWFVYRIRCHPWTTQALPRIGATLADYGRLMRLDRPIGAYLLLWPTLWALWISRDGEPRPAIFTIFVVGVLLMRSAGCVINDYADRDFDPHVARTMDRPLAAGRVSAGEALVLAAILGVVALALALQLDPLALRLAVVGALLALSYPFIKRFLSVPQLYLGLSFGWGIPMAFAAQLGKVPRIAWLLFLANFLWVVVYDTIYAMVDRDDDRKIGVRSTALLFGDSDRHIIAVLQGMTLLALVLVGRQSGLGVWYWSGLIAAAAFFARQQWLIRRREPEGCFRAFLNNHYVGMSVFIGILLNYQFR
ncbi:MAG TPA: 4-hydroxybenzoate octaprenyltransferase [Steroidobacteraceae bacterium]|nr:4-hydroxybenzoate octaprenyltransferase [Steroidobacteraceae bacterium]